MKKNKYIKYNLRTFKRRLKTTINKNNKKNYGISIITKRVIKISKLKNYNYKNLMIHYKEYQNLNFSRGNQRLGGGKSNPLNISLNYPKRSIISYMPIKTIYSNKIKNIKNRDNINKIISVYTYKWMKHLNINIYINKI